MRMENNVVQLIPRTPEAIQLLKLALTFPSLMRRDVKSLRDLKSIAEDQSPLCGKGAREAARFCLWVWEPISYGAHNTYVAWAVWDDAHRAAWLAWSAAPWWA